jgi:hypothetical protein
MQQQLQAPRQRSRKVSCLLITDECHSMVCSAVVTAVQAAVAFTGPAWMMLLLFGYQNMKSSLLI